MRVAVVDRSRAVREAIAGLLRGRAGVLEAASLRELLAVSEPVDVVVADFSACAEPCRQDLEALRRKWPGVRLVVAAPGDEGEYGRAAESLAADGWIPKPRLGLLLPALLDRLEGSLATAR
jgi:DNA-binding NarL/FixJ family response regulator